jgi:hypothetical protein
MGSVTEANSSSQAPIGRSAQRVRSEAIPNPIPP